MICSNLIKFTIRCKQCVYFLLSFLFSLFILKTCETLNQRNLVCLWKCLHKTSNLMCASTVANVTFAPCIWPPKRGQMQLKWKHIHTQCQEQHALVNEWMFVVSIGFAWNPSIQHAWSIKSIYRSSITCDNRSFHCSNWNL